MSPRLLLLFICFSVVLPSCTSSNTAAPPQVETPTSTGLLDPQITVSLPTGTDTPGQSFIPTATVRPGQSITPTGSLQDTGIVLNFSRYGPIAYLDDSDGYTIRMVSPDGSEVDWSYKSDLPGVNHLSWSPDGANLVLSTTWDGLNIVSVNDGSIGSLPNTRRFSIISYASFSPDGSAIAFFAYNEGHIFLADVAGTWLLDLTPSSAYRNSSEFPSWSPSGEHIIYSRRPDGQIYMMDADGNGVRQLTSSGYNEHPVFSPDGRRIAFIRYGGQVPYLYLMSPEGGNLQALSDETLSVEDFSWSPDGRYIVFSYRLNNVSPLTHKYGIVDIKTGGIVDLVPPTSGNINIAWSPRMRSVESRSDCTGGWTRLQVRNGISLAGESSTRVRSGPSTSGNVVGQVLPGESFILLDGPVCADGLVFWEIADPGLPGGSGWTAEGDGTEYFLEPWRP